MIVKFVGVHGVLERYHCGNLFETALKSKSCQFSDRFGKPRPSNSGKKTCFFHEWSLLGYVFVFQPFGGP